jgi:RNA polymerase sigma factor (TIGR02999 family)
MVWYIFLSSGKRLFMGACSVEITRLLKAWGGGDEAALTRLAERVYPELRMMARRYMKDERQANTLQTTALVHEVYLRLVDVSKVEWRERAQFFAMAAQMMRRILVDAARARGAHKRGGGAHKVNLDEAALLSSEPERCILALDDALTAFSQIAPRQAKVVEMRYFGGLKEEEIVAALQISPRTVRRDWDLAKAWLLRELSHTMRQSPAHDPGALSAN